jgi:F-box interacting protein
MYEILLRLPARDLCRFRAVCRAWRSLLSSPNFIAAHAARHPGPLVVASYDESRYHSNDPNRGILCDIMDLSGNVVKRVGMTPGKLEGEWVMSIQLDLICRGEGFKGRLQCPGLKESYELLNLATGAVYALPKGLAKEHARHEHNYYQTFIAFGKVASTGEYKVLRVLDNPSGRSPLQLYEVFTLDGSRNFRWRGNKGPSDIVQLELWKSVVIGGVVYFLSYMPDCITSFDLETEDWREDLRGPLSGLMAINLYWFHNLSLATLSGCLVVVHDTCASVDLWFLVDCERGLWVKQHSIPTSVPCAKYQVGPLLVLDDGKIVLMYLGDKGLVRAYNPRTNTFTDIAEMGCCVAVGLYTGSLLSLPSSASK